MKQNNGKQWWCLTLFQHAPCWMQDNPHIHSGYRQASYSYGRSFASVLQLHNETVNIWSHGIPALLSLPTACYLYLLLRPRYDKASTGDMITMGTFFFSAALALGISATFHAVSNHSPAVAKKFNQLDYAGIACLIAGSFVPSVYYGFWCDRRRQVVYWSMVSTLLLVLPRPCANISLLDISTGYCLHRRICVSEVQDAGVETYESRDVRWHGVIGRLSSDRWSSPVWFRADEGADGCCMGHIPRSIVHSGRRPVCGQSLIHLVAQIGMLTKLR